MPRSPTPVGFPCAPPLAQGNAAFRTSDAVGSPQRNSISGLHLAAYILAPPGSVLGLLLRTQDLLPACRAGFGRVGLPGGPLPGHPLGGLDGFHRTRVPFPPSRVLLGTTPDKSGFARRAGGFVMAKLASASATHSPGIHA